LAYNKQPLSPHLLSTEVVVVMNAFYHCLSGQDKESRI